MTHRITLQAEQGVSIRLEFAGPFVPNALNPFDEGWRQARVEIAAGGFRGVFRLELQASELAHFEKELSEAYRTLKGEVVLELFEGQLKLWLKADWRGHFVGKGEARDVAGTGNRLLFDMDIDQTRIPPCLEDLRAFLAAYPQRT